MDIFLTNLEVFAIIYFLKKTAIYGWFVDVIYLVTLRKALDYMYLQSNDKL